MAETTLRAYLQEIDDLVEHEHLDEAIAHCRHVLQIYPKHVETYRLLGKSYLEAKRFGDAADLFQRVLSAIPDDFVAHIGMSIVREDEGNLDASIWHMERAFETNPANPAIQQELRRLIGRRDGLEPHKVRLTRGALARMYAHGELYPQAIAELRSALQEDPDRPDLQTLLAEMYWRTEQRAEAVEVCNRLLEKLPFCREGLRILAAVLHAGGQVDEAAVYHRRLASLDPYAAFLETAVADPRTVDAGAVKLDKLVWHAGQPLPSGEAVRPQWNPRPGVAESKDAAPSDVPSWVSALEMPSSAPADSRSPQEAGEPAFSTTAGETPLAADIPEWMRQAGWSESSGQAVEKPVTFSEEELAGLDSGNVVPPPAAGDELQPAELPDWLKKIAPASGPTYSGEPRTQPVAPRDLPDWLGEFAIGEGAEKGVSEPAAAAGPSGQEETGSRGSAGSRTPGETIPTWLEKPADGATETIVTWLGRRDRPSESVEPSTPEEAAAPASQPSAAEEEIPSWVTRMPASGAAEPARPEEEAEGLPSWLSGVAEAASQEDAINQADLEAMRPAAPMPAREELEPEEEPSTPMAKADAPDWLRAIVGGELSPAMAAQSVTPPRGLKRLEPDVAEKTPAAPAPIQEQAPSWMGGLGEAAGAKAGQETVEESEPEWLRGLGEPEPKAEPAGLDWLRGVSDAAASAAPAEGETVGEPESSEPGAVPWQTGASPEPPDWMKGAPSVELRAEETAAAPPESVAPEETFAPTESPKTPVSAHAPPDWLREFAEPEPQESQVEETLTPAEIPSWLREFGDRGHPAGEVPAAAMAPEEVPSSEFEGALDWLQESASEVAPDPAQAETAAPPQAAPPAPPEMAVSEPVPDDEVFRWLEDLATRQGEEQPAAAAPSSPPSAAPPTLTAPSSGVVPESADEGIEWLERLAEERGAGTTPVAPVQAPPPVPLEAPQPAEETEWLREIATAPSAEMSTDLWDKIETQPTEPPVPERAAETPAMEIPPTVEAPPTAKAPPRPAAEETLPGTRRPILAPPPLPSIEPERSRTTPLTESEVVEWLAQTASAAKGVQPAPPPQPVAEEEIVVPEEADPAASLAVQLIEAGRAALSAGDVPAAVQAYAPVIDRGLMLDKAIEDLKRAAEARPDATALWQALGDAYKKSNRMPEAFKAYSKARKEEDGLEMARQALAAGDFALAVMHYGGLIKKKRDLESVIEDLRAAVDRDPRRPALWQALGDAYMKTNRLPEAIDAYRRGMESV